MTRPEEKSEEKSSHDAGEREPDFVPILQQNLSSNSDENITHRATESTPRSPLERLPSLDKAPVFHNSSSSSSSSSPPLAGMGSFNPAMISSHSSAAAAAAAASAVGSAASNNANIATANRASVAATPASSTGSMDLPFFHPLNPSNPYRETKGSYSSSSLHLPRIVASSSSTTPPKVIPAETLINNRPPCPCIWFAHDELIYSLPILDFQLMSHFYVSTAVVRIHILFQNTFDKVGVIPAVLFCLPIKGTVTSVNLKIGNIVAAVEEEEQKRKEKEHPEEETKEKDSDKKKKQLKRSASSLRHLETAVLPKSELSSLSRRTVSTSSIPLAFSSASFEEYVPDLFRLPISDVRRGEQILLEIDYLEPLDYLGGKYHFKFPTAFPPELLPKNRPRVEAVRLYASLYTLTPTVGISSHSHTLQLLQHAGRVDITATDTVPNPQLKKNGGKDETKDDTTAAPAAREFHVSYAMSSKEVIGTCIKELEENDQPGAATATSDTNAEKGTFALFVTPPTADAIKKASSSFSRHIIFLLDRSGSMTGAPYDEAIDGLEIALQTLSPTDQFTVLAFDHEMLLWHTKLWQATKENTAHALKWCRAIPPQRGGTNIKTPLAWAVKTLQTIFETDAEVRKSSLPFVFLLTDGCVEEERQICQLLLKQPTPIRLLTFGIGTFANWYFLRMLAEIGRGYNQNVIYKEHIREKVSLLLSMASQPVLSNINVSIEGVQHCDLYPFPIPDLFGGAPVLVAGQYTTAANTPFPKELLMSGSVADGRSVALPITTQTNPMLPVSKIFLKQRIDLLTSRCWLTEDKALEQEIIDLSITEEMPSNYTAMVAYEVTQKELEKRRKMEEEYDREEEQRRAKKAAGAGGGAVGKKDGADEKKGKDEAAEPPVVKKKPVWKKHLTGKKVAGMAVGGAIVVVGAIALATGDLASTLGNIPIGEVVHAVVSGDCGCCNCCDQIGDVCECVCSHVETCAKCFC